MFYINYFYMRFLENRLCPLCKFEVEDELHTDIIIITTKYEMEFFSVWKIIERG
jgi:hypothetical protein